MKIAILLPNWVGDLAMATPALRALRQQYPTATLIGVVKPYLVDVLEGNPWLDQLLPCSHQRWFGKQAFWPTVSRLRSEKLDAVVSLRGTMRGAFMSLACGAKQRVGYGRQYFSSVYSKKYSPPHVKHGGAVQSAVDVYLQTVARFDCESHSSRLELFTTPQDEQHADAVWQRLKLPPPSQTVMIHAGSAQGSAKLWPVQNAANLAQLLVDRRRVGILINCGPQEREQAREIAKLAHRPNVVSLAEEKQLPFGLLKGLIRRVRMVISTDSGPRHLAAALGTPVVAVFGAMDPALSQNYHPQESIVRLKLECMPCNDYTCPLGHLRCMRDLSAEQVLDATEGYWKADRMRAA